ncbi:LemA family protein [Desulfitibacter alkalitolerans]|uniref:LemA family protein n=1 Tax=Desulfitibacter alkalitolerans TaxID=264641 RepID=UPI000558C122|nr:LemA family protein [Desulfitibacter alkalitolerans]
MTAFIIGIISIILALAVLMAAYLIILYNGLVKIRNMVHNSWYQIDVQLKRRYDLIPNLVETVKAYASHERQVFENVTRARAMAAQAGTMEERQNAENMLSGALKSLFAVAEAYPQLQASQNFSQLQREMSDLESKIAFARQFYNDTTMKYNTKIQTFPTNIFSSLLGFQYIPYFMAEEQARNNIQVKF